MVRAVFDGNHYAVRVDGLINIGERWDLVDVHDVDVQCDIMVLLLELLGDLNTIGALDY